MAKSARAGELRTKIQIQTQEKTVNQNGIEIVAWKTTCTTWCKWVNAYGREVFDAKQAGLNETSTLTMRYTDRMLPTCRILKGEDQRPYDVISINDVEDRHVWLEVKVSRRVESQ